MIRSEIMNWISLKGVTYNFTTAGEGQEARQSHSDN